MDLSIFSYPFIQRMFIAGFLASIVCGIIGTYIVVKRIVFISGGIAHATFGGIGLAYYLQFMLGWMWFTPIIGATLTAVGAAGAMNSRHLKSQMREDSTIGLLWVLGMAIGLLLLNAVDRSKILVQDPMSILFGNILLIEATDLYLMAALTIVIVILVVVLYKDLQLLTFDEEFAKISGVNTHLLNLLLLLMVSLTTVVTLKVVGVVLIIAMLTIPASISGLFTRELKGMMGGAIVVGILTTFCGSLLSIFYDTAPGPTIVLLMGLVFIVCLIIQRLLGDALPSKHA